MFTFKDPTGAAHAAVIAVSCYALFDLVLALAAFFLPPDNTQAGLVAIADFLALAASLILVGRWIYRTNANAHSFSDDISITPGWAVGWFFVPVANLVKPYQGVKETWVASHQASAQYEQVESPLLALWWGLWIATNVASTISTRIASRSEEPIPFLLSFDILVSIVNVALCIILIQLMQRLSRAQVTASHGNIFT
ncbi:MAG TPA: DUF4328 domain-containing protein [Allosphingosinicella sp.]|nr:DUF4328 domain-containing protein [Allosphingosinicella sp.]